MQDNLVNAFNDIKIPPRLEEDYISIVYEFSKYNIRIGKYSHRTINIAFTNEPPLTIVKSKILLVGGSMSKFDPYSKHFTWLKEYCHLDENHAFKLKLTKEITIKLGNKRDKFFYALGEGKTKKIKHGAYLWTYLQPKSHTYKKVTKAKKK